mmetsp:Transcript_37180/g.93314  ORF Transcript_37180/g.93314 Transcript_37180/m.93314 type:complete len:283 (-) Transcript_37180:2076-2924(-)
MRHDHKRPGVVLDGLLEHLLGGNVQVVGRLVQDQQVARTQQHLAQSQPRLLAAAEHSHRLVHILSSEHETRQEIPDILWRESFFLPCGVFVGVIDLHDGLQGRPVEIQRISLVLFEVVDDCAGPLDLRRAPDGLLQTQYETQQGRLAHPVRSEYGDSFVVSDREVHLVKKLHLQVAHAVGRVAVRHILQMDHFLDSLGRGGKPESEWRDRLWRPGNEVVTLEQLLQGTLLLLGHVCHGRVASVLGDERPVVLNLLLLPLVRLIPRVKPLRPQLLEQTVVAVI